MKTIRTLAFDFGASSGRAILGEYDGERVTLQEVHRFPNEPVEVIPGPVLEKIRTIWTFVVEETRTARRFLSRAGLKGQISGLEFHELNEHTDPRDVEGYLQLFNDGNDVGLISEAGLPAVADPGATIRRAIIPDACTDVFRAGRAVIRILRIPAGED